MKQIALGIVAHVDAGKTTLTESLLYHGGSIRKMGRVDHRDSFLDYDFQERNRGITIYSKTALFDYEDVTFTIVDTPGHTDFSAEMERTLRILDAVILVINGQNGVQSHTETIWKLLEYYHLPVFVFVNKMDIAVSEQDQLMGNLEKMLSPECICFNSSRQQILEKVAMSDEKLLDKYMNDQLGADDIRTAINQRRIFPCYFGSALKDQGIDELMKGLHEYCVEREYPNQLALRVFKVGYDDNGTRLCYCRILGGSLLSKEKINENDKVDQIYLLNGTKSTLLPKAEPGMVVAIKGLDGFIAGQSIGLPEDEKPAVLTAYMNYRVILPPHTDTNMMMKQLTILSEEDPQITVSYQQELKEIHLQLMGEIQLEIIRNIILKRTGVTIDFDNGKVLFKETILNTVTGVGHFEPLRHYAEVVLRLQPLPLNSGLVFESEASTDDLAGNWQNLIMTHLKEKQHRGVLTGSPITDMKITLVAGRAHLKHTEGGDFRQATYRAVRQGLKKADSIILEPYYDFTITVDNAHLSKVLYDIEMMNGNVSVQQLSDGLMEVKGNAPVRKMQNYQTTLASYTSGKGRIMMEMSGYQPCRSQDEIIAMFNYDSERDFSNPTGSVFCAHGSGFYVPYDLVEQYMHIKPQQENNISSAGSANRRSVSESELKNVVDNAGGRNRNRNKQMVQHQKKDDDGKKSSVKMVPKKPTILLADGYNLVFGWEKTKKLAYDDIDLAREMVIKQLASYGGYKGYKVTAVFDAYRRSDNPGSSYNAGNVKVVFTRANETADSYIEKISEELRKDYRVIVVSSDAMVQSVALGNGAIRMSAREIEKQLESFERK